MGYLLVYILGGTIGLFRGAGTAVDGGIDAPHGGTLVHALQPHQVLVFCPVSLVLQPQAVVHGLQDGVGLLAIRGSVLAYQFGYACRQQVGTVVIGRRVGDGAAAVVEGVGGPDAAVGIVEVVAIGVKVTLLPGQVTPQHRPHLKEIGAVGIILEVPQQFVDVVQVHVIVVHLVIALGVAADVAVGVHLRAPLFLGSRQVLLLILRRMQVSHRHVRHLALGIGLKMTLGTLRPAQHVAQIAGTPACQRHAPANAAVQPRLTVPVTVGSHDEGTAQGIDIGVGGIELYAAGQLLHGLLCLVEAVGSHAAVGHRHVSAVTLHVAFLVERQRQLLHGLVAVGLEGIAGIDAQVTIARQLRLADA